MLWDGKDVLVIDMSRDLWIVLKTPKIGATSWLLLSMVSQFIVYFPQSYEE